MKKNTYLLILLGIVSILYSCGKDDPKVIDEEWKAANEKAFKDLTPNPDYSRIISASNMGYIFYKTLKNGTGAERIYFTDSVRVYYTGSLINDSIFDSAEPPYKYPAEFYVGGQTGNGLVDGFQTALQHMTIGDRWEVWMPQELAYGANGTNDGVKYIIPPYSTLKFEIEILGIKRNGFWL